MRLVHLLRKHWSPAHQMWGKLFDFFGESNNWGVLGVFWGTIFVDFFGGIEFGCF